jgi:hypothetical protein
MGWVLASRLPQVPVQELETLGLVVLALTVVSVGTYALVARCLRDAQPEDRPEILRALADLLGGLRNGASKQDHAPLVRRVGGHDEGRRPVRCAWRRPGTGDQAPSARLP